MIEPEIEMRNGHNHCRGSGGKYGRCAAYGCGIPLIPLRLGAVVLVNCIDAESLAKCVITPDLKYHPPLL